MITHGRYGRFWRLDLAAIFERIRFRCGSLADALS